MDELYVPAPNGLAMLQSDIALQALDDCPLVLRTPTEAP
jgi:hypothetical protein